MTDDDLHTLFAGLRAEVARVGEDVRNQNEGLKEIDTLLHILIGGMARIEAAANEEPGPNPLKEQIERMTAAVQALSKQMMKLPDQIGEAVAVGLAEGLAGRVVQ